MKILVIRRDNIGDLVCTTPLFAALRARYPQAHIAALVNSYNAAVLEGNRDVDAVYAYTKLKHRAPGDSAFGIVLEDDGTRDTIYGSVAALDDDTIEGFVGGSPTSPGADMLVIQGLSLAKAKKLDGDAVDGSLSLADVGGGTVWMPGVAGAVDTMLGGGGEVLIYVY